MAGFEVLVPVLTMTLMFCGMGRLRKSGTAELPPGHDVVVGLAIVGASWWTLEWRRCWMDALVSWCEGGDLAAWYSRMNRSLGSATEVGGVE